MAKNAKVWFGLIGVLLLWFGASLVMGQLGLFDQADKPPAFVGLFLGGSIAGFLAAYRTSKTLRAALLAMPLWLIVSIHVFRFVGIFFITYVLSKDLAPQFGLPAGIGDITAATASIPLTIALKRGRRSKQLRRVFIAWNIFGLADLFSAISLGLLYSPSSLGVLTTPGSDSKALAHLPLCLIPTFYVPVLILLHFLALRRYRETLPTPGYVTKKGGDNF